MTVELQKLMGQFALLFVAVYVIASAMGKQSQAQVGKPKARNHPGGCNAWRGQYSQFGAGRPAAYQSSVASAAGVPTTPGTWVL